ncbi:MAG: Fe-S protein assembly co-chaperone HscB [Ferruginibacter sp.]
MNHFELFGIPQGFNIDKELLSKKYVVLQKKYHPDFFSQATTEEKEEALQLSSQVNNAYKIFQHQEATIKYVLQLHQLLEEEEKYQLPPAFLMEMMELNEEMMEGNENIAGRVDQINKEIYEVVKPVIDNYQEGITSKEELLQIKNYYYQKKYLNRITEQLNGML